MRPLSSFGFNFNLAFNLGFNFNAQEGAAAVHMQPLRRVEAVGKNLFYFFREVGMGRRCKLDPGLKAPPPGFTKFDCEKDDSAPVNLNIVSELAPLRRGGRSRRARHARPLRDGGQIRHAQPPGSRVHPDDAAAAGVQRRDLRG